MKRARKFRYTLRFLGLAVFVFGVAFAWFAWEMKRNRDRRAAVRQWSEKGASVIQLRIPDPDDPFGSDALGSDPFGPSMADDTFFAKLCRLLGEDPPVAVDGIHFTRGGDYSDEDIAIIGLFPEATYVDIAKDYLSEQNLSAIMSIDNLHDLSLTCFQLPVTDAAFGDHSQLKSLCLRNADLGDSAIRSICKLRHLTELDLSDVAISASRESLDELRRLDNLSHLNLEGSHQDPWAKFPVMPQVRHLTMACDTWAGTDSLKVLKSFPNLEFLACARYPFGSSATDGMDFINLRHTPKLQSLDLRLADISDDALKHICDHAQLRNLSISSSVVTDAGISHLRSMRSLVNLDLSHSPNVGDVGLRAIWDLPDLQVLNISNTAVTTSARDEFYSSHPNCSISESLCTF